MTLVLLLAPAPAVSNIYTKQGAGVLTGISLGADVFEDPEAGMGISPRTVLGPDSVTTPETGMVVMTAVAAGQDSVTTPETATVATDLSVFCVFSVTSTETGITYSDYEATGPDETTFDEAGLIDSTRTATGGKVTTYTESAAGVIPMSAAGVEVFSPASFYLKSGIATKVTVGSGADAFTSQEIDWRGIHLSNLLIVSPTLVLDVDGHFMTGSGGKILAPKILSGSVYSERTGSGSDASTDAVGNASEMERVASGLKRMTFTKTGAGALTRTIAGSAFLPTAVVTLTFGPSVLIETSFTATESTTFTSSEGLLITTGASDV